ncbi:transposase [Rhizobium rhizophilum]|uniref:Transposase n=1 Tax=Rhizobium rhizophilum TaxID=1850373 RepID=A0ABY2QRT4_9HYPH|nr:transposase [Rhizobium rhizophilum]
MVLTSRWLGSFSHDVKLIVPQLAKLFVKRGKNDGADAEALSQAMSPPTMRFVTAKTTDQQAAFLLVGVRQRLLDNRTQLANAIPGFPMEFGGVAAKGMRRIEPLLERLAADESLPGSGRELFALHGEEHRELIRKIEQVDEWLMKLHRADECSKRLAAIPGVGPVGHRS